MPRVYPVGATKLCPSCNQTLLREAFPIARGKPLGIASHCKECRKARYPYDSEKHRMVHLRNRYGLEWEEYIELFLSQNKQCKICGVALDLTDKSTHLDHCHSTGKVRGFLCRDCNHGLGKFKDNPALMRNAAKYIEDSNGT